MEKIGIKRMRSEEDAPFTVQQKMFVNEKTIMKNDSAKLKAMHEKTREILFAGARIRADHSDATKVPLWQQVVLLGNGIIEFRNGLKKKDLTESRQSKCCQRKALIHSNCFNCTHELCEECGYSCIECGQFLCGSCVSLFGCGTIERPMCDKCSMFC